MSRPDELRHVGSPTEVSPGVGHGLGPHVVGQRVVVRRLVPGRTGPTGGPAFTDLLGVAERWHPALLVRLEDGTAVEVPHSLIVSGKPVPPRPNRLLRVPAGDVQRRVRAMWPGDRAPLGDWWLQAAPPYAGRVRRRSSSVLAYGDPGVPLDDALAEAGAWLAARDRPLELNVAVGSDLEATLRERGWREPDDLAGRHVAVQVAALAQVRRTLRGLSATTGPEPDLETVEGGPALGLRAVVHGEGHDLVAGGAAEVRGDDVCLHDLRTHPSYQRRGHALRVVDTLLDGAAERGATTVLLHVLADNSAATALYGRLGFVVHHTATYLAPPR